MTATILERSADTPASLPLGLPPHTTSLLPRAETLKGDKEARRERTDERGDGKETGAASDKNAEKSKPDGK